MRISVMVVRSILGELRRGGHSTTGVIPAQLDRPAFLDDMRNMITMQELEEILKRATRISGDGALGLSLGSTAPLAEFQLFEVLARSAPTVADAFSSFHRHSPLLMQGLNLSLQTVGARAEFRFRLHGSTPPSAARFCAESLAALAYRFVLHTDPRLRLDCVHFAHPQPADAHRYADTFKCRAVFDATANYASFDAAVLQSRPATHDRAVDRAVHDAASELLLSALPPASAVDQVREVLRMWPSRNAVGSPSLAKDLRLSARSLKRRLARSGTSVKKLADEVRLQVACEELLRPNSAIKEVADRLGFSDRCAFHRAFKRWTGQTPGQFARANSSRPPA